MQAPTPWRRLLYKQMETVEVSGKTLDLGGSRKSGYHELLKGDKEIVVVNFDEQYGFDLNFDIEKNFPIEDKSYDSVLCINTLEHVYDHVHVIKETRRIMKNDGVFVIAVPFIMFVHPCPNDHWRYTAQTLKRLLQDNGFSRVEITSVGKGPFLGALQIIYPALTFSILRNIAYAVALSLDKIVSVRMKNAAEQYPLGYLIKARP